MGRVALLLLTVMLLCHSLRGQEQPKPQSLMHKKLEYSKQILEGLTVENYEQIAVNARAMNRLGLEQWEHANQPEYKAQLLVFRTANDALLRNAEDKNIDGAALAYVQMTMSCVNCHQYIRARSK